IVRGNIVKPGTDRESMFRITAMLLLLAMASPASAQQGGDLQAQIVYASQTEDLNALADLEAGLLAQLGENGGDAALRYHLAHAQYRYALLAAQRSPRPAEQAASGCVDQLKPVLRQNPH